MTARVELLEEPDRVRTALSPARRELLERLREPSSATRLAAELGVSRQRVNYHLRALEDAGLVELVEERQRRGFTERVVRTRPGAFLVDPAIAAGRPPADPARAQDRFAAEHLLDTATGLVRDVARMQAAAAETDTRLLTFTLETEVGFARPGDVEAFVLDLAHAVEEIGRRHSGRPGRPYRVVIGGHPAARQQEDA
ncbi:MAG TPA: winged helix-turn-helix domain-containing protein [Mycobacteriales bacterium]|nr:winged helix-turn-helix domain-containing protein [Mycobacteriales bacterium]